MKLKHLPLGVSKLGANELVLSGPNTYTGATVVNGGKLTLTHTNTSGHPERDAFPHRSR